MKNLTLETEYIIQLANDLMQLNQVDPYAFGLIAASLYNLGRVADAEKVAD